MEEEHRRIISVKMKLAVHKKLHPEVVESDRNINETDDGRKILDTNQNPLQLNSQKRVQVTKYFFSSKLTLSNSCRTFLSKTVLETIFSKAEYELKYIPYLPNTFI